MSMFDSIKDALAQLRSGRVAEPEVAVIPSERCSPPGSAGYQILRDQMYFSIRVSEMHLSKSREWWSIYDPLIFVVVEFNHGTERVAVPVVIGPELIRRKRQQDSPRYGSVLLDTLVAGPYPYRGGDVDLTVAFYQVQRANGARGILRVIDSLSSSLGELAQMKVIAKAGTAILEGIEDLLGMQETAYLAGMRTPLSPSPLDPFSAGFLALITPPSPQIEHLWIDQRRLKHKADGELKRYRDSDFVLLNVIGTVERGEENRLPFYQMKADALNAIWDGEDGLKRGKAHLIAAYQQMRKSDDMTSAEAAKLFDAWMKEFAAERALLENSRSMGGIAPKHPPSLLAHDLNAAVRQLEL